MRWCQKQHLVVTNLTTTITLIRHHGWTWLLATTSHPFAHPDHEIETTFNTTYYNMELNKSAVCYTRRRIHVTCISIRVIYRSPNAQTLAWASCHHCELVNHGWILITKWNHFQHFQHKIALNHLKCPPYDVLKLIMSPFGPLQGKCPVYDHQMPLKLRCLGNGFSTSRVMMFVFTKPNVIYIPLTWRKLSWK